MTIYPSLETAAGYAREFKRVPVMADMLADMLTPVSVYLSIKQKYEHCFLLESAQVAADGQAADSGGAAGEAALGRYSIIGYDASLRVVYKNSELRVITANSEDVIKTADPFAVVNDILLQNLSPVMPGMPKFAGGLAGYLSYDTVRCEEPVLGTPPLDDLALPDIQLMDCSRIIVFDHLRHSVSLLTLAYTDGDFAANYTAAAAVLDEMARFLKRLPPPAAPAAQTAPFKATSRLSQDDFMKMVECAKEHIYNGDIFQVVLSRRMDIENPPDSFNVYRALRADEPSPYMYYFDFGDCVVAGSSPEKLVSSVNGLVTTNPIAGTIKRGETAPEDAAFAKKLINDEKERAEHVMLVDLSRNDLGRICEFGTVAVDKFMEIGRFSRLMHIISQVSGTLRPGLCQTDVLRACLPAGTLSGAPKIRAMQIIDALEPVKRGIYGGAAGYLGYNGISDTCITIRTAVFVRDKAFIQTGAGVVADSDPVSEFNETRIKARAMLGAFEKAGEL